MTPRISFGISVLVILAALSGCVVSNGGEPTEGTTATTRRDIETAGPTAVILIMANGTQVYSSADASDGSSGGNGTGNTTAGGNTTSASGNTTASGGTGSPTPTTSGAAPTTSTASPTPSSPSSTLEAAPIQTTSSAANSTNATDDNSTSNDTGAGVTVEPGVNVTFDGSDSEGDNLSFSWSIGNVTSENETFDHMFTETGTYNVTLTVTDLLNATDEETVTVTVGSGSAGPAPGTVVAVEEHTFNGGTVSGGTPTCTSVSSSTTDKTYTLTINDTVNGTAVDVKTIVLEASYGAAGYAARLTLRDPAGEQVGQANNDLEVEGPLAPGEYSIVYRICGPYSSSSTVDVTVTYVAR